MYRSILLIVVLSYMVDISISEDGFDLDETVIETSTTISPDDDDPSIEEALASLKKCDLSDGRPGYYVPQHLCVNTVIIVGTLIPRLGTEDPYLCCSIESPRGCGLHHSNGDRSGTQANDAEFPWSVALISTNLKQDLQDKNGYFCGGSLIHSRVVLSATSCFHNRPASEIVAFVGGRDLTNDSIKANGIPVSEIVRHEDYYDGDRSNNIALLFLSEEVNLGPTIDTICLPEKNADEPINLQCVATGWGPDQKYRYPRTMQVLEMTSTTRYTCQREVQMSTGNINWKLDKNTLCAKANMDNCAADGGSPLICQVEGNKAVYIQYGILSIGSNCGKRPAQYTKISSMRNWIDEKIIQHKYTTGNYTYKSYK